MNRRESAFLIRHSLRATIVGAVVLLLALPVTMAGGWVTRLDTPEFGALYSDIAPLNDGTAGLVNGLRVIEPSGANVPATHFRFWDGASWSAPQRLDQDIPPWNGMPINLLSGHHIEAFTTPSISPLVRAPKFVVGVHGRYTGSSVPPDGSRYAFLVRTGDGVNWKPWITATPVGEVIRVDIAGQNQKQMYIVWMFRRDANTHAIYLRTFNASTGQLGPIELIEDNATPAWNGDLTLKVAAARSGDAWITYGDTGGVVARVRKTSGVLSQQIPVFTETGFFYSFHDTVWAADTLWVVSQQDGIPVYRLSGHQFVEDEDELFPDTFSLSFNYPAIAARPEGRGVAVGGREDNSSTNDTNTVARERTTTGWQPKQTVSNRAWLNLGGNMDSSATGVWLTGVEVSGSNRRLFVAERPVD